MIICEGSVVWNIFICYVISMVFVLVSISKGVESSGKVSLVTATMPYILLMAMMLYGVCLDGAFEGIKYLFRPDLSRILDQTVWQEAATQVLFQQSVGLGVLIIFGTTIT